MTTWSGRTSDGTYGLLLEDPALRDLDRMCRDTAAVETGGVLIGRYSVDLAVAIVREATPPPSDSRRGHTWFERGVAGLREMLGRRWRARERTYYVGEWHFHPASRVVPSSDDFSQMVQIAHAEEYDCKEPLLVILGAGESRGMRSLRAFVCPVGGSPLELLPTKEPREPVAS